MEQVTFVNNAVNARLAKILSASKVKQGFESSVTVQEDKIVIQWNEKQESEISPKQACYQALLNNVENNNDVYLPNAYNEVKAFVTPKQWSGYLGALTKEGLYNPVDDFFGEVFTK